MGLVQKSFSDIITFSRSSNATRVGPTGLVEYAPHNLLTYSQEFDNAAWAKSNTTVTANAAAAPNGTVTADLLTENTSNASHQIYVTPSIDLSITNTFSVYVKPNGRTKFLLLLMKNAGAYDNVQADFDTAALTATTTTAGGGVAVSASITSVGSGWFRCTVSGSTTFNGSNFVLLGLKNGAGASSYTGDGTSGIYLWGAQLSVGPYALDYTPTTSAAVYGPRFDYNGSGVTIVEPVSRNLVLYSEQFDNAAWTATNATVSANNAVSPDGQTTADKLVETVSGVVQHKIEQTFSSGLTSSTAYTFSVFVKTAGRSWIALEMAGTLGGGYAYFNIANGTIGTEVNLTGTSTITAMGNGWYRCSVTDTSTGSGGAATKTGIFIANADNSTSYAGDGSSGILLWGAQLEVGSTATGYMVSGATNGFRAVPVVSGSATARGLLVEEQRTNLLTYSEQFDNAAWTKLELNVTANAVAAPDGTITADFLSETTVNDQHAVYVSFSTTSGTAYSMSFYAKANQRSKISLFLGFGLFTDRFAWFDLATGAVGGVSGSTISAAITSVGNGWYRCSVSATAIATGSAAFGVALQITGSAGAESYAGTAGYGIYLWGAQLEAGSFATSYIPTLASTVTRSADVASVNTLSPWFNNTEGTLFVDSSSQATAYSAALYTDIGNYISFLNGTAGAAYEVVVAGSTQASIGTRGLSTKVAGAYKANDFAVSVNGGVAATDTSGTVPTITDRLQLGSFPGVGFYINGYLRRVAFFPRRLSNAELAALTS